MNDKALDVLDPPRTKLRALAAQIEQHLSELTTGVERNGDSQAAQLSVAWHAFTKVLDLGEEPAMRTCPHCQRRVLDVATRCRYCMASSPAVRGHASEPQ